MTVLYACDSDELERLVGDFAERHMDSPSLRAHLQDIRDAVEDEETTHWGSIHAALGEVALITTGEVHDYALALIELIENHGLVRNVYV